MSRLSLPTGATAQRPGPDGATPSGPAPGVDPGRVRADLERLLHGGACPTCKSLEESERSFFSWFAIETFTTVEMQTRLRTAMGMCPAHLRRLIDEASEPHILTTVMREAVAGARQRLRGDGAPGPCPACEAAAFAGDRASRLLAEGLLDPVHARRYAEQASTCLPHLLQAVALADAAVVKVLAARMLVTLEDAGDDAILDRLAGVDRDGARRALWRRALPDELAAGSTVEGLCLRFALGACPVCLAAGWTERRYVRWFVECSGEHDPSLDTDPGELCSGHLNDVGTADRAAALRAAERKRAGRRAELLGLLDNLARVAGGSRRRGNRVRELDGARAELLSEHYCSACHARAGIERSQLDLVVASASMSSIGERYANSHGLCARHALLVNDARAARLLKRHADARLGVLVWELQEGGRKQAWAYRHERGGPEQDAWRRAAAQIDGRVFQGGPATR